jgi:thiol-disulfide isomerase/thioredoxin
MIPYKKTILLILLIFFFNGITSTVFSQSGVTTQVKVINILDLEKIVNQNEGRALIINVWATWCLPCREEFPDLVKLANDYNKNIRIVGISVDDYDDLNSKVIPFLEQQNAEFENYLLKVVDPEDFINLLNKDWSGAIPATFIYDNTGKQNESLIGKHSYELFEKAIKKVID